MTFNAKTNTDNHRAAGVGVVEDSLRAVLLHIFICLPGLLNSNSTHYMPALGAVLAHMLKRGNKMKLNKNGIADLEAFGRALHQLQRWLQKCICMYVCVPCY